MIDVDAGVDVSTKPRLILVVEDEAVIRDFICEILNDEGLQTEYAENADIALEFLNERASDVCLLLTDIYMPGSMNGAALANLSAQRWPQIPVMITSGHETPQSSGVTNPVVFLRKPWSIGQLIDSVSQAMLQSAPTTGPALVVGPPEH